MVCLGVCVRAWVGGCNLHAFLYTAYRLTRDAFKTKNPDTLNKTCRATAYSDAVSALLRVFLGIQRTVAQHGSCRSLEKCYVNKRLDVKMYLWPNPVRREGEAARFLLHAAGAAAALASQTLPGARTSHWYGQMDPRFRARLQCPWILGHEDSELRRCPPKRIDFCGRRALGNRLERLV